MPIASIRLSPGLDIEDTPTYDSATYNATSYGRFKAKLFQKLGGWQPYFPFVLNGTGKALHAWQDLNENKYLGVGTTTRLNTILSGNIANISPQTLETDPSEDFSTVNGDATVTIVDPNVTNVSTDDAVYFRTPISVGGLILSGLYQIATRTGAHSYTIEARANATATVNNGGSVPSFGVTSGSSNVDVTLNGHAQVEDNTVVFDIPTIVGGITIQGKYTVNSVTSVNVFVISASTIATSTTSASMNGGNAGLTYYIAIGPGGTSGGYGLGAYGGGFYGIGDGGGGSAQSGSDLVATDWSLDNWGEQLIASPENGAIYYWSPTSGFQNASIISTAPFFNAGAFVSMAQQQIIAYGSSVNAWDAATQTSGVAGIGVYQDPLVVNWCDISNFFDWTATSENSAGSNRIPTGSGIIGGAATQNRNLIWTDLDLWGMAFTSNALVYNFNKLGANCGLVGKHAWAQIGGSVFWMGKSNFFFWSGGGVQPITCPAWDIVFQDLDQDNAYKCVAGSNSDFSEIWFFYPSISGGLGYPDKCLKINILENPPTWDSIPMGRGAWIDRSILGPPISINSGVQLIYTQETGQDANDTPMMPSFETGYFYLDEGETFSFVDQIIPDFKWGTISGEQNAQISITILAVETPGETPTEYGPFLVTQQTKYVDCRIRAKLLAVRVSSTDAGSFWRIGLIRFRYAPDGRR